MGSFSTLVAIEDQATAAEGETPFPIASFRSRYHRRCRIEQKTCTGRAHTIPPTHHHLLALMWLLLLPHFLLIYSPVFAAAGLTLLF